MYSARGAPPPHGAGVCACVRVCAGTPHGGASGVRARRAWGQGRRSPGAAALILRVGAPTLRAREAIWAGLGARAQAAGGVRGASAHSRTVLEPAKTAAHRMQRFRAPVYVYTRSAGSLGRAIGIAIAIAVTRVLLRAGAVPSRLAHGWTPTSVRPRAPDNSNYCINNPAFARIAPGSVIISRTAASAAHPPCAWPRRERREARTPVLSVCPRGLRVSRGQSHWSLGAK
ncbi:hypothetical protein HYPSUDRAFT_196011 [Hypholoma sublateritium FD-334 SS-4]|uniref:Uncharacterized protein n=1 Tax=Hypholoma sublateritium (strain FD-334 SS-4) TaxID=945553 RepID=A0A0D2LNL9_HYPSF|nr:hypothetical protein HYPSUDRAFT_196011 [Hypholoma sublateritium FD-334 SS-4]